MTIGMYIVEHVPRTEPIMEEVGYVIKHSNNISTGFIYYKNRSLCLNFQFSNLGRSLLGKGIRL